MLFAAFACSASAATHGWVGARPLNGAVELTWDTSTPATGYLVYVTWGNLPFKKITLDPVAGPPYMVTGLQNGTEYQFYVALVSKDGRERESDIVVATPRAELPPVESPPEEAFAPTPAPSWSRALPPAIPQGGIGPLPEGLTFREIAGGGAFDQIPIGYPTYLFRIAHLGLGLSVQYHMPAHAFTATVAVGDSYEAIVNYTSPYGGGPGPGLGVLAAATDFGASARIGGDWNHGGFDAGAAVEDVAGQAQGTFSASVWIGMHEGAYAFASLLTEMPLLAYPLARVGFGYRDPRLAVAASVGIAPGEDSTGSGSATDLMIEGDIPLGGGWWVGAGVHALPGGVPTFGPQGALSLRLSYTRR